MTPSSHFVGGADYAPLTESTIRSFLDGLAAAKAILGGAPDAWSVREVGDGNLNLVFIVKGPASGVCVKQALPYVCWWARAGRCRSTGFISSTRP